MPKFFMEDEVAAIHMHLVRASIRVKLAWHEGYPSGFVPGFKEMIVDVEDKLDLLTMEVQTWLVKKRREHEVTHSSMDVSETTGIPEQ